MKSLFKYVKILIPIFVLIILALFVQIWLSSNSFDETILDENNIYNHVVELTQKEYNGRLAGSAGNEKAVEYITDFFEENGIEPAGENGTYYQQFSTIVPQFDTQPEFNLKSPTGEIVREFEMYEDYLIISSMLGGSVEFSGDLILVGTNMLRIDTELIKDRIVVALQASDLTYDRVSYIMQHGGKGMISVYDDQFAYGEPQDYINDKYLSVSAKTGQSMMVGYMCAKSYRYLLGYIEDNNLEQGQYYEGIVPNVNIKVDIGFPVVSTQNVLGKIEGKEKNGRTLLIAASIDGVGESIDGEYYPGAISSASAMATLMETARVIKEQKNLPYETIVFIGFNAEEMMAGSEYYVDHPLFPLEKTTVIYLENIGESEREGTWIFSDQINSTILNSQFRNYANDSGLTTTVSGRYYSAINKFADKKIAAIMLSDLPFKANSYDDTAENVEKEALKNTSMALMQFIKRDIYKDVGVDYLSAIDRLIIMLFVLGLAFNYIVTRLYKTNPIAMIGKRRVEDIYFNSIVVAFRKLYFYITPIILTIFLLAFLANINPESNIKTVNNETVTNFSLYLTTKSSVFYLKSLFSFSGEGLAKSAGIWEVIFKSSIRTIKLMLTSLIIAMVVGISRGMFEGYKAKKANMRSLGTLLIFSIPDVLIVLMGVMVYIFVSQNYPGVKDIIKLDEFVIPLITLCILPTIYISRITFITIEEEIKKEYTKNAKAKGFSRARVFTKELFPAIIFKIIDTLPAIMTIIISNMIVVEYLFNYNGIVYYLLYFFKKQDINGFIALSIALGVIYIVFTWGIKFIAKQINPVKKEEKNA